MRRVCLLLVLLAVVACSSEADPASTDPTTPAGTTSSSEVPPPATTASAPMTTTSLAATTSMATTTSMAAIAPTIEIVVANGERQTELRHEVALGSLVVLAVTSDVTDEIHVHTYDVTADAIAGETVLMEFEASIPGIFEVELESTHLQILELVVQ